MYERERMMDIEALARMAARLAGRDPDEQVRMDFAGGAPVGGVMWRYEDFMKRAEAAYHTLSAPHPPSNGRNGLKPASCPPGHAGSGAARKRPLSTQS